MQTLSKKLLNPTTRKIVIPGPDDLNIPSNDLGDYAILLMGAKGVGKTTATASWPDNLNFQWEPWRANVSLRMIGADDGIIVRTAQQIMDGAEDPWLLFIDYTAAAMEDDTIKSFAWDSVDLAYQACFESICARKGVTHPTQVEKDYGNTWNDIKNEFTALISTIRAGGKGIVFISHVKEREQEYTEGTTALEMIGPSCTPACLKIMKDVCSFWLYYGWKDGQRTVWCRDPDRFIDVSCGTGFINKKGELLNSFHIPANKPKLFYPTLNHAFKTGEPCLPISNNSIKTNKKKASKKKSSK